MCVFSQKDAQSRSLLCCLQEVFLDYLEIDEEEKKDLIRE